MKIGDFNNTLATAQAITLLERSISSLCVLLETDIESVKSSTNNPYPETDQRFPAFECLKQEISILERLKKDEQ